MTRVSAGEFAATVTKACLGAGVERGTAVELGPACLELALLDKRPVPALMRLLETSVSHDDGSNWEGRDSGWICPVVASPSDAVSMIDFAMLSGAGVRSPQVMFPLLVMGLALNRMRSHDVCFEVSLEANDWSGLVETARCAPDRAGPIKMAMRSCAEERPESLSDIRSIDVADADWSALDVWVAKTLVPADESNRADAGAGNTDND